MIITILNYSTAEVHQIKTNIELTESEIENIISKQGHRINDIFYMVHDTEEITKTELTLDPKTNYNESKNFL